MSQLSVLRDVRLVRGERSVVFPQTLRCKRFISEDRGLRSVTSLSEQSRRVRAERPVSGAMSEKLLPERFRSTRDASFESGFRSVIPVQSWQCSMVSAERLDSGDKSVILSHPEQSIDLSDVK